MDIFTLELTGVPGSPSDATYANGDIVNGLDTKLWVERYWAPGEFTFTAKPTNDILEKLALDTLITHTDSDIVMIVEDHEITEKMGEDPVLKITGRSLDSFLNFRVATNAGFGFSPSNADDTQKDWVTANVVDVTNQLVNLIKDNFVEAEVLQASWAQPGITVVALDSITQDSGDFELPRGPLYDVVMNVLKEHDMAMKAIRPNRYRYAGNDIAFAIYKGVDQSLDVVFRYDAGDIYDAKYFWSSRSHFNAAYTWSGYEARYNNADASTGFARRVTSFDCSDIKMHPNTAGETTALKNLLLKRYQRRIKKTKRKALVEATISRSNSYTYRQDYNVGDLVRVKGNYDVNQKLRVVEYAETEDENGEFGYPVLAADE